MRLRGITASKALRDTIRVHLEPFVTGVYMKARYAAVAAISAAIALGSLTGCGGDAARASAEASAEEAQGDVQTGYAGQLGYELSEAVEYQGIKLKVDPSWEVQTYDSGEFSIIIDSGSHTIINIMTALHGQTQTLEGAWAMYLDSVEPPTVTNEWNNNGYISGFGYWRKVLIHYACESDSGKGYMMHMVYSDELMTAEQAEGLFNEVASTIEWTPAETSVDYGDAHAESDGGTASTDESQGHAETEASPGIERTEPVQEPAAPETTRYEEGMYKVGADLPAGEYKLTCQSDDAYWGVTNSSDADADIVGNDIFSGSAYVTVYDGQYLTLRRCIAEPAA